MNTAQIAQTILDQLGGQKFLAMTGAQYLVHGQNSKGNFLQFKIRGGKTIVITLTEDDEYSVEMLRLNRKTFEFKTLRAARHVFACQLQDVFTAVTGLHTKLA